MQVDREERRLVVTEGDNVDLNCSLTTAAAGPTLAYPLTWFYTGSTRPGENVTLAELTLGGLLRQPGGGSPGRRLSLSRPDPRTFRLSLQGARLGDSGAYWCRLEQHRLGQEGRWQQVAVGTSGRTLLTVGVPGKTVT